MIFSGGKFGVSHHSCVLTCFARACARPANFKMNINSPSYIKAVQSVLPGTALRFTMHSIEDIVVQNGVYGNRKGNGQYIPRSNCTLRFKHAVDAGDFCGYLGVVTHKDGSEREFFYPSRVKKVKDRSNFLTAINYSSGSGQNFNKTHYIHMPSSMLEGLMCKLEEELEDDELVKAVSRVGKNLGKNDQPIWILDGHTAIDGYGRMVTDIKPYGLVWISHLIDGNGIDIAKEDYKASINLPLSTKGFNAICHFLRGDLQAAACRDQEIQSFIDKVGLNLCPGDQLETSAPADPNFLSLFYIISMSCIIANYEECQEAVGACPIVVAVGSPGSGKTTASKVALASTGGWPKRFFSSFTDKVCGRVATYTTLGFVADDPTEPKDLGDAAKRFYDAGTATSCSGTWTPSSCPMFTVNQHVIEWLLKPERARLIDRLLLIPVPPKQKDKMPNPEGWNTAFNKLLKEVSSVIGEVIALGQWLKTGDGMEFRKECSEIVVEACGESSRSSRMVKMWSMGLLVVRKMGQLTCAVTDEELISHFKDVIAPYCIARQLPITGLSTISTPSSSQDDDEIIIKSLEQSLVEMVQDLDSKTVQSFLQPNKSATFETGHEEQALAIRMGKLLKLQLQTGKPATNDKALRKTVVSKRSGKQSDQRFWSPSKGCNTSKSCLLLKRKLFSETSLTVLDASVIDNEEATRLGEAGISGMAGKVDGNARKKLCLDQGTQYERKVMDQGTQCERKVMDQATQYERKLIDKAIQCDQVDETLAKERGFDDTYTTDDESEVCKMCGMRDAPDMRKSKKREKPIKDSWVQCDGCQEWFHVNCTGLKESEVPGKDNQWFCQACAHKLQTTCI